MMETEQLELNPLYKKFQEHASELLKEMQLVQQNLKQKRLNSMERECTLILCVPQALSLRGDITLDLVRSHLILSYENLLFTLDGYDISMRNNKIFVKQSKRFVEMHPRWTMNTEQRVLRIILTEDLTIGPNFSNGLKVIYTDRPVRGGCESSCTLEGLCIESVEQCIWLLSALPELESMFRNLDSVVRSAKERLAKQFTNPDLDSLEQVRKGVRYWIRYAAKKIIEESPDFVCMYAPDIGSHATTPDLSSQIKRHTMLLEQAMEAYVCKPLQPYILKILQERHTMQNERFNSAMEQLVKQGFTQEDLGVKPEYQCGQSAAVAILVELQSKSTPLEMLQCLDQVVEAINAAIYENTSLHYHDGARYQVTTDDMLDQLIYVLILGYDLGIRNLTTYIQYMRLFHTTNLHTSTLGYNLANLEVAVEWVVASKNLNFKSISYRLIENARLFRETHSTNRKWSVEVQSAYSPTPKCYFIPEVGVLTQGASALNDVKMLACSKFSRDMYCWIEATGRIKVSTGMHHVMLSRQRFISVSCGENHMMALTEGGEIFAWGDNRDGQVGLGLSMKRVERCTTPVSVKMRKNTSIKKICCGGRHSMAICNKNNIWTWGRGKCGRLGHNDTVSEFAPKLIESIANQTIVDICAGWSHSVAITAEGQVYSWGCGLDGRLGLGSYADALEPTLISKYLFSVDPAVSIATGYAHTCILSVSRTVRTCGNDYFGQLGLAESVPVQNKQPIPVDTAPPTRRMSLLNAVRAIVPSLGRVRSFKNLSMRFFGQETASELSTQDADKGLVRRRSTLEEANEDALEVYLRQRSGGCAVSLVPEVVTALQSKAVVSIDCGQFHTAVVTSGGSVYTWGSRTNSMSIEPMLLSSAISGAADAVVCGMSDTFVCCGKEIMTSLRDS